MRATVAPCTVTDPSHGLETVSVSPSSIRTPKSLAWIEHGKIAAKTKNFFTILNLQYSAVRRSQTQFSGLRRDYSETQTGLRWKDENERRSSRSGLGVCSALGADAVYLVVSDQIGEEVATPVLVLATTFQ